MIIGSVLTGSVYRQLAELYRLTEAALELVRIQAPAAEVDRAISDAFAAHATLTELLGKPDNEIGSQLTRHLGWMNRYYQRGEHSKYATDVVDIRERDLPAVAAYVEEWERALLDPQLVEAVARAWADRNYLAVVRDAFVHLEERLREFGDVDPGSGMSGDKLVDLLFGPAGAGIARLPTGGLLGPVTKGERTGLLHLFKAAFLFARNPTAHRRIDYSPQEAQAIVQLVDLCLRVISARS